MQEEVSPGLKITLVGRLVRIGGHRPIGRQIDSMRHGYALGYDDLLLARKCQAEVLARGQLQVLVAIEVLVIERQIVVL